MVLECGQDLRRKCFNGGIVSSGAFTLKIGNILLVVGNHVGHVCLIELISREFFELCFCSRKL